MLVTPALFLLHPLGNRDLEISNICSVEDIRPGLFIFFRGVLITLHVLVLITLFVWQVQRLSFSLFSFFFNIQQHIIELSLLLLICRNAKEQCLSRILDQEAVVSGHVLV